MRGGKRTRRAKVNNKPLKESTQGKPIMEKRGGGGGKGRKLNTKFFTKK